MLKLLKVLIEDEIKTSNMAKEDSAQAEQQTAEAAAAADDNDVDATLLSSINKTNYEIESGILPGEK